MARWKTATVGDVATLVSGGTPSRKEAAFWGGTVPWITCKDMKSDRIGDSSERITKSGLDAGSRLVPAGSVLVVIRGMILARDVPVAVATKPVAFNQDLKALLPGDAIDSEFLLFALKAKVRALQQMTARAAHGTKSLTTSNVANLEIPLPPLAEQRQIARVLSAVQRAIERQERLIALTAELKKALMHKLFTEGTRGEPMKQTEIGNVPESWQVVKLADAVSRIDYGISAPIPKTVPLDGVKIVSTADITKDGEILYHKIRRIVAPDRTVQRLTLKDGDVLFNWRNSSELIGKSAVFGEQGDTHVFASFILRIRCDEQRSHNMFLCYLMNYFREQGVFVKLSRRAVNQANYNRNEISVLAIPLPPIEDQMEIARTITAAVEVRNVHVRTRDALQMLFKSLLHQLMTAQIRVHSLNLSALDGIADEVIEPVAELVEAS